MDKRKESRKIYNSDKTFIQISKDLHLKVKDHCLKNNISIRKFIEDIIFKNIK